MSAELLKRAAEKLREVAGKATPGPWVAARDEESMVWDLRTEAPTQWQWQKDIFSVHTPDPSWPDIDYCAVMHPGVALALAEWMEAEAQWAEGPEGVIGVSAYAPMLARVILREEPSDG